MAQPVRKKTGTFQKPRSKAVKKTTSGKTAGRKDRRLPSNIATVKKKTVRKHPLYGTSKLEERFATEFLDKIGVEYIYQYKAESIGRYFDFRIKPYGPIIEIQGSYWHGDKRLYEESELNSIQKRNKRVDEKKLKWCQMNGIPIIYIWEKDINSDPDGVLNYLREKLKKYITKRPIKHGYENENSGN